MKQIDRILFIYTSLFSVIILVMAFINRRDNSGGIVMFLLFLPVLGFLLLQIVQSFYQRRYGTVEPDDSEESELALIKQKYQSQEFVPIEASHLKYFFQQRTPSFLLTMALLSIATSATILRAGIGLLNNSANDTSSSTNNGLIWPIPTES